MRDQLFGFYDWCAWHDDIPELITLARTISRWEDQITAAVITGITNATAESLNRIAKLEARQAYGFRNPANQRRRVRIAWTRGYRRRSRTATPRKTHPVTGPKPDPGYCTVTSKAHVTSTARYVSEPLDNRRNHGPLLILGNSGIRAAPPLQRADLPLKATDYTCTARSRLRL